MNLKESYAKDSSQIARVILIIKENTHVPSNLINIVRHSASYRGSYLYKIIITVFTERENPLYIEKLRPIILSNNRSTIMIYNKKLNLENLRKCLKNNTTGELLTIFIDHELENVIQYVKKLGYEIKYLYTHSKEGEKK